MSVKIKMFTAFVLCFLFLSLSACAVRIDPPLEMTPEQEAKNMGFSACAYDDDIEVGSYEYLKVNILFDYEDEVKWSTSDPEIAVVDSTGRVDGIKEGKAIITATAKKASIDYEIKVTKADKEKVSYSTAFTDNSEIIKENKSLGTDKNLYAIIVNEYNCSITVVTYNSKSEKEYYNKPVRAMVCSTAKKPLTKDDDETWINDEITEKSEWVYLSDGNYYRYATYIGEDIMFQSAPYESEDPASLKSEEFNKIGTNATTKNIRLSVADAKWIYDNCNEGTKVKIVNSDNMSYFYPLGVPENIKLTENSASLKYDPTDHAEGNPYVKLKPVISGADDITVELGNGFDLYSGVTAVDTCGNDITERIEIDSRANVHNEGRYVVSYFVTDNMNRTTRVDRVITVVKDLSKQPVTTTTE